MFKSGDPPPLYQVIVMYLYLCIFRLFVPKNRDEEVLLLLLISESIVSQGFWYNPRALPCLAQSILTVPQTTDYSCVPEYGTLLHLYYYKELKLYFLLPYLIRAVS